VRIPPADRDPMPADGDWGYEKTIAAIAGKIT
jgi:hypothetical protein